MAGVGIKVRVDIGKLQKMIADSDKAAEKMVNNTILYGVQKAMEYAPVKTGHLRRSIHPLKKSTHEGTYGTAVVYAAIQEFGGTIKAQKTKVIRPKSKPYLQFKVDGRWVRVKEVHSKNLFFKNGDRWVAKPQVKIKGKFYLTRSAQAVESALPQLAKKSLQEAGIL